MDAIILVVNNLTLALNVLEKSTLTGRYSSLSGDIFSLMKELKSLTLGSSKI